MRIRSSDTPLKVGLQINFMNWMWLIDLFKSWITIMNEICEFNVIIRLI